AAFGCQVNYAYTRRKSFHFGAKGSRFRRTMAERKNDAVDATDRDIIRLLQRNGRTSNTEIGRALGLTETTIRKRIARLLDEGLLTIVAVPSPRAVGTTMSAIIGVSVDLGQLDGASQTIAAFPEVRYLGISTGRYDLIV